jgi:3-hydroxymyristoyl/3-hydroxydecanoyl-(acyl carrier protein) dehydratase
MIDIENTIPHRAPLLLVDKVDEISANKIITSKFYSGEEAFFAGHFPHRPILPGIMMLEGMFQAGAVLAKQKNTSPNSLGVVTRVDKVKFRKLLTPPVTVHCQVELNDQIGNALFFKGKVLDHEQKVVATAEFSVNLVPNLAEGKIA